MTVYTGRKKETWEKSMLQLIRATIDVLMLSLKIAAAWCEDAVKLEQGVSNAFLEW